MAALGVDVIARLVEPYYPGAPGVLVESLSAYLDLLLKWNGRTNLTAIRAPEEMVRRHFGESLFLARYVPEEAKTLLDLGSGAGFPGIPVALARRDVRVTLAESQNKKAAFLREAVRTLGLQTEVWAGRAEDLPGFYDVVALRAVDNPELALGIAGRKVREGGLLLHLTTAGGEVGTGKEEVGLPGGYRQCLRVMRGVPRGTMVVRDAVQP